MNETFKLIYTYMLFTLMVSPLFELVYFFDKYLEFNSGFFINFILNFLFYLPVLITVLIASRYIKRIPIELIFLFFIVIYYIILLCMFMPNNLYAYQLQIFEYGSLGDGFWKFSSMVSGALLLSMLFASLIVKALDKSYYK